MQDVGVPPFEPATTQPHLLAAHRVLRKWPWANTQITAHLLMIPGYVMHLNNDSHIWSLDCSDSTINPLAKTEPIPIAEDRH
jgi:hypothetical protein